MAQDKAMIVAEDLNKLYQESGTTRILALDHVSLRVNEGEFIAIVGPSGSGKTTLLNILGTLDTPSTGKLQVDGADLTSMKNDQLATFRRQTIGFVFQLFNLVQLGGCNPPINEPIPASSGRPNSVDYSHQAVLVPVLSAFDNVKLPLMPYPPKTFDLDKRAHELLAQVGLAQRIGHLPSQLSGGEQQRLAVARALINQPPLLLADEPTGNLDTRAGAELMNLLATLHQDGMTIIMVTQDQEIAQRAERIVELRDGKTIISELIRGKTAILRRPKNRR